MAKTPPKLNITIPAAPASSKAAKSNPLDIYLAKYPAWKKLYVPYVRDAMIAYTGVSPLQVMSLMQFQIQRGGSLNIQTGAATKMIPAYWIGKQIPALGATVTPEWASKVENVIQFYAWATQDAIDNQVAGQAPIYRYIQGPNYKGPAPTGYGIPLTAAQAASTSGASRSTTPGEKTITSNLNTLAQAANKTSQILQAHAQYDSIYLAYTGKRPNEQDLLSLIANPISTYQLELSLANPRTNPNLFKSPIWQTHSPTYSAYYQQLYGPQAKAPQSVLLYGVVHNLDENAFESLLRKNQIPGQQSYETSEDYKTQYAQLQSAYAGIYGLPDATGAAAIKQMVLQGWSQAQAENYLRSQPEYTSSGEYKERAISLANQMGFTVGASEQTVLGTGRPRNGFGAAMQEENPADRANPKVPRPEILPHAPTAITPASDKRTQRQAAQQAALAQTKALPGGRVNG